MRKDFSTYFPYLFGPKLSVTIKFLKLYIVCLGSETVCSEKDVPAFYSPLAHT